MKKAVISIIFALLCLFSIAQESSSSGNIFAANKSYIAALKQQTEAPEDNLTANNNYKLKDIDGNSYTTIKIGNQFWMAENLKATKFNDGTDIPLVNYGKSWSNLISPGYCWFNNDVTGYKAIYGALYNGYTVSTGKLCPVGWHVPAASEWTILINYCGENVAGGKLKEINLQYWMGPNEGATNETGFKALPSGCRGNLGMFMDRRLRGHWWSSTEVDDTIWDSSMSYSHSTVDGGTDRKQSGLSVRCVKDK
jgi:uncharacterized protein (TIGR02145 family)